MRYSEFKEVIEKVEKKYADMSEKFEVIHHEENMDDEEEPIHAEYYEATHKGLWGLGKTKEEAIENLKGNLEAQGK